MQAKFVLCAVMPNPGKTSRDKGKTQIQAKLTSFGTQSMEHRASKHANTNIKATAHCGIVLSGVKEEILMAISNLKSKFSTRLDGILNAFEETKKELFDCIERMTVEETQLYTVEDVQAQLQETVWTLKKGNKALESKVINMETRSAISPPTHRTHYFGHKPTFQRDNW